jgi:hypothetical protein
MTTIATTADDCTRRPERLLHPIVNSSRQNDLDCNDCTQLQRPLIAAVGRSAAARAPHSAARAKPRPSSCLYSTESVHNPRRGRSTHDQHQAHLDGLGGRDGPESATVTLPSAFTVASGAGSGFEVRASQGCIYMHVKDMVRAPFHEVPTRCPRPAGARRPGGAGQGPSGGKLTGDRLDPRLARVLQNFPSRTRDVAPRRTISPRCTDG